MCAVCMCAHMGIPMTEIAGVLIALAWLRLRWRTWIGTGYPEQMHRSSSPARSGP